MRKVREENFWKHVDKNGPNPDHVKNIGPCWIWKGSKCKNGYGRFFFGLSRPELVHRISWRIHFKIHKTGMRVLHKCDNPSCVNPDHLFEGTPKDNTNDCIKKGRFKFKQKQSHCVNGHELTEENTIKWQNKRCCKICKKSYLKTYYLKRKLLANK